MLQNSPFYTNVTQKGQVTLPVDYRAQVGISSKSKVVVSVSDGEIRIRPVKDISNYFGKISGKSSRKKDFNPDKLREYLEENYGQ